MHPENASAPVPFLFLNVGGVLTNAATAWTHGENASDPDLLDATALKMVEKLCRELGAHVVMATNWATRYPTAEEWRKLFASKGVNIPVVDVLPNTEPVRWRAAVSYMAAHPGSKWALLEDGSQPPHLEALISVSALTGLTTKHLERAASAMARGSKVAEDLRWLHHEYATRR